MPCRIFAVAVLYVVWGGIPVIAGDPPLGLNLSAPPDHLDYDLAQR